ncbi:MAG: MFS transporter [Actinomycetota bacterium]
METPEQPDAVVEELERSSAEMRERARADIGVTGRSDLTGLRFAVREAGVSYYPLVALTALSLSNYFQGYTLFALAPDIGRSLGLSVGAFALISAFERLAVSFSPFPMAWLSQRKARRAFLCIATAVVWSLATLYTGFIVGLAGLVIIVLLDGVTTGSVLALHYPLLMDSYPPSVRVRMASTYAALGGVGLPFVLSALLVALLTGPLDLTWRGVFVALAVLAMACTLVGLRLRDPGYGRFDLQRVRETVHAAHGDTSQVREEEVRLGFFEIMRRILLIPTIKRLLVAQFTLGIFTIPLNTFVAFFLDEKFGFGPTARSLFFGLTSSTGILAIILAAKRGEAIFRKDPSRIPILAGVVFFATVVAFSLAAIVPTIPAVVVMFCLGFGLQSMLYPIFNVTALSLVDPRWRPHSSALAGVFLSAGGVLGALFLSGIQRRFGLAGALISLAIPGVISALIIASASRTLNRDLDQMLDQVVEAEEIERIQAAGGRLPMLSCKRIDFSYGKLQVLFDVDFTVEEAELVALLGVNGAGKSTLLKVISGIGLPSKGTVRFQGQDVTYLDAERRLRLGITQVPGGRAVFAPLSVVDNMRVYGYALGRNDRTLDEAIDRSFDAFPQLARRRNQLASTLSGGEQQMLGLCKALILRPRLLLIDELSLGLAPVVVGQLLDMVRKINDDGTAVVLVEQSVNIALSVARHAYFMERGEIRFDGPSSELIGRDDLLRAVFLEGAGRADV